ncbi:hypothetical protein E2C01_047368 [Portunus trituberculatus]|uniref:Uncharacterized protein n=1 Tax=Portunus trituberculatus TaxID=210409 RepID=A0A5B7G7Q8_PORTR|nr:hypothetical protein [Portunus trituberculatus]
MVQVRQNLGRLPFGAQYDQTNEITSWVKQRSRQQTNIEGWRSSRAWAKKWSNSKEQRSSPKSNINGRKLASIVRPQRRPDQRTMERRPNIDGRADLSLQGRQTRGAARLKGFEFATLARIAREMEQFSLVGGNILLTNTRLSSLVPQRVVTQFSSHFSTFSSSFSPSSSSSRHRDEHTASHNVSVAASLYRWENIH